MTDIINLNSIRSDNCDCNKPKLHSCGCNNHNVQPCQLQLINLSDLYFKVKNLFGELKSEWQREEARLNLGVTNIIDLRLTKESLLSGGLNEWTMTTSKGGVEKKYTLYVRNGQQGESATIEIVSLDCELAPDATPVVRNLGTENHAQYMIKLPKGKQGEDGAPGESAFAIANRVRRSLHLDPFETEEAWLASLKGPQGEPGTSGKDGEDGNSIESVELVDYGPYTKTFLNNLQLSAKMFIWRVTWKSGRTADIWVPENVGGGSVVPVGTPTFLYKLITFSNKPQDSDFRRTLDDLYAEVNKDSSGRTVEYLIENKNWRKTAPVISQPGYEFIYMATSVITEDSVGLWSVVQLTGVLGAEGPEGPLGPQGPAGPGGSSGQGLIGPVIRMRGSWSSGNCYVNLSNLAQNGTELRFIDIVVYNGEYWMVSPGIVGCAEGAPSNSNTNWIKAVEFDFAYINTLIADYIKNYTIDTSEVRIHKVDNWNNPTDDEIVAGMTSGRPVSDWEVNNNNTGDPIRIWAGTNVDILDNNGNNVSYPLDLENAKFKVRLSGKLEATDADIEGTIQANTLRLGKLNASNEGTFICPENTNGITLPKLASNKIQMFYILTNHSNITSNITVTAQGTDKILYTNGTTTIKDSTFSAKPNKLYQLFGVSNGTSEVWYVVELDLAAATVIINPEEDTNFCGIESIIIITNDEWTKPNDLVEEYILQTLNIKGSVYVLFKNETNTQKTINAEDIRIKIKYDAQAIEIDPAMLMIPSQLANQVSYTLTLHLLSSLVSSNGSKLLTYQYIGNNTYNDSSTATIGNISYNGTSTASNATYNGKPDIGVVTVTPGTINKNIKTTEDGDTKITLTNIPVTVL